MRCELCKRGIADGVALHRQNEKGIKGVWRCLDCNMLPVDPEVQTILDCLAEPKKDKYDIQ